MSVEPETMTTQPNERVAEERLRELRKTVCMLTPDDKGDGGQWEPFEAALDALIAAARVAKDESSRGATEAEVEAAVDALLNASCEMENPPAQGEMTEPRSDAEHEAARAAYDKARANLLALLRQGRAESGGGEREPSSKLDTHSFLHHGKTGEEGVYRTETWWAVRDDTGRHVAHFFHEAEARSYVALHNAAPVPPLAASEERED
jgi:hypothetical protein